MENAKIALIQFCVSPPKTDIENSIVINDYTQMDRRARLGVAGVWSQIQNLVAASWQQRARV